MSRKSSVPEVGYWARDKIDSLTKYLHAYTTILEKRTYLKGYVYIDAFAGTGQATIRDKKANDSSGGDFLPLRLANLYTKYKYAVGEDLKEYIKGSPKEALDLKHPFTDYVFIEKDRKRYRELEKLRAEYPARKIYLHNRDCNQYLQELLISIPSEQWKKWRGIVFLDPFGTQVPWQTLSDLGNNGSFEIFVNMSWMAINRLANNKGENIRLKNRKRLNEYFGSEEWFDVMYELRGRNFFGRPSYQKRHDAANRLISWYKKRLEKTFGLVSSARLIRNSRNSLLYCLIWAGRQPVGKKVVDEIFSQGEAI